MDIIEAIARLVDLKAGGHLTEEEYQEQKSQLLNTLSASSPEATPIGEENMERIMEQAIHRVFPNIQWESDKTKQIFPGGISQMAHILLELRKIIYPFIEPGELSSEQMMFLYKFHVTVFTRKILMPKMVGFDSPSTTDEAITKNFLDVPEATVQAALDVSKGILYKQFHLLGDNQTISELGELIGFPTMAEKNATPIETHTEDADFGLVANKPVFVAGIFAEYDYTNRLKSDDGRELQYERWGSCSAGGIEGPVDIYEFKYLDGSPKATVYISMYSTTTSTTTPRGFTFADAPSRKQKNTTSPSPAATPKETRIVSYIGIESPICKREDGRFQVLLRLRKSDGVEAAPAVEGRPILCITKSETVALRAAAPGPKKFEVKGMEKAFIVVNQVPVNTTENSISTASAVDKKPINHRKPIVVILLIVVAIIAIYNVYRDHEIQESRDAYVVAIDSYEQAVLKNDSELSGYESEVIDVSILETIVPRQEEVIRTSNLLLGLNTNTYYGASQYNENIYVYQSQMASLNNVIGEANKRYEMNKVSSVPPVTIHKPTDKKFLEILGIKSQSKLPTPSQDIEGINNGISARYEVQKTIRDAWSEKAKEINGTQDTINSLRNQLYSLYGTTSGGINVETGSHVKE
jgi:hypothetical protein